MKLKKSSLLILPVVIGLLAGFNWTNRNSTGINHKAVPDSELVDANNNPVNISQFRGKVVLINNWASWCPPCIAEMPSIQKLKHTLGNEKIAFVMVSYDDAPEKAMRFMQKKNYDFEVYFPGKKYPYHTQSIPATFVLDQNGKVLAVHNGMANFDKPEVVEKFKSLMK